MFIRARARAGGRGGVDPLRNRKLDYFFLYLICGPHALAAFSFAISLSILFSILLHPLVSFDSSSREDRPSRKEGKRRRAAYRAIECGIAGESFRLLPLCPIGLSLSLLRSLRPLHTRAIFLNSDSSIAFRARCGRWEERRRRRRGERISERKKLNLA